MPFGDTISKYYALTDMLKNYALSKLDQSTNSGLGKLFRIDPESRLNRQNTWNTALG